MPARGVDIVSLLAPDRCGDTAVTEDSEVELHLLLRGMFFYLAPISDAVDGHYEAGENHRDFLTMDLIGMFDLRVLP